jgi:hypothetical protein
MGKDRIRTDLFGRLIPPKVSWREGQSAAAKRKTDARRGTIMEEAKKAFRGIGTEVREFARGIPRVIRGEKTLRQIARRASRKGWKVQTGRIGRK